MMTVYATRDDDGARCLWRLKPRRVENGTMWWRMGGLLAFATGCEDSRAVIRALFPRGMKPGEIRKFRLPRLGEEK